MADPGYPRRPARYADRTRCTDCIGVNHVGSDLLERSSPLEEAFGRVPWPVTIEPVVWQYMTGNTNLRILVDDWTIGRTYHRRADAMTAE